MDPSLVHMEANMGEGIYIWHFESLELGCQFHLRDSFLSNLTPLIFSEHPLLLAATELLSEWAYIWLQGCLEALA